LNSVSFKNQDWPSAKITSENIEVQIKLQNVYFASATQGALMLEAARTSETSVDIQLRTRQCIPEVSCLHTRLHENLKSRLLLSKRAWPDTFRPASSGNTLFHQKQNCNTFMEQSP
jgi:hypothetical protein